MSGYYQLTLTASAEHLACLQTLPWHVPLEEWRNHGVRHLRIRSGLSRHLVVFIERQQRRYAIKQTSPETARREIETYTRLNIDEHLPRFYKPGAGKVLLKHINEHRWYLGERLKGEAGLAEAAQDWLQKIYAPVCAFFNRSGWSEDFPSKTAADLYLDIMENKYFLSQREGRDVGIAAAVEDYWQRFRERSSIGKQLQRLARRAAAILEPYHRPRRKRPSRRNASRKILASPHHVRILRSTANPEER